MDSSQLETQQPGPTAQDIAPAPAKKPYSAPTLIVHGTIAEITGGGKLGFDDLDGTGTLVS
jgi:hypothetical protein